MTAALRVLVRKHEQNFGPYSVDELNSMLVSGRVHPDNLAWIEGAPEWQRVKSVPGVRAVPPAPPVASHSSSAPRAAGESDRLVLPAFLLAFFLGVLGAHRFYCGKTGSGLAMLLLTLTGIGLIVTGIWATIDWIIIVCSGFRDDQGRLLTRWT